MTERRKTLKRIEDTSSTRYITFSCDGRKDLLDEPEARDRFVERLKFVHEALPFELYEWVVMSSHVHILLRSVQDGLDVSKILERLKSRFAAGEIRRIRARGLTIERIWLPGGGYDWNIYSADEFEEKRNYIINNPVVAGYVARPEEWKWSSVGWPERFWDHPYGW